MAMSTSFPPIQFLERSGDYILFLSGLALVLLGVLCIIMERDSTPWVWLGLYGFTHGLDQWLDMLALGLGDSATLSSVRLGIMALSFAFLFEFGRRSLHAGLYWWACVSVAALAASGGLAWVTGLHAAVRCSFGFVGGMMTALALFRLSQAEPARQHTLRAAALLMAGYAVVAGILIPRAPSLVLTGAPMLIVLFSMAIWRYYRLSEQTQVSLESGRAIRELSLTDELTGSYNRRGFQTLAGQELKVAARLRQNLTLLYADLDGLKRINDSFGHKEGDRALVDTANILKGNQRASDIIARLGGDEFVVLTIETSNGGSEVMAARLQAGIAAHNARGERPHALSISIGVTHYEPDSQCTVEQLLERGDRAMYEVKKGRPMHR